MKYVLGIDFGGGASKATLLSEKGEIAAVSTVEYPTLYPQSGWTEQDPADWYEATRKNISNLLTQSGVDAHEIVAVCPDAATHTAVLLDEKDEVVCPSIYWTDIRSQAEVAYLREHYGDLIRREVLHSPDTIWTLPQLMWIKSNRPDQWSRVRKILFAKDYVRQRLTGDFVTDNIEAEGSMLFDYNRQCWSQELCGILDLDVDSLPRVVTPDQRVGEITPSAAADTMVAKLSSARIISATFLVTSVPVMPIPTPISAFLIEGASLTPSPVIAVTLPFLRQALTMRVLCSGCTRA